MVKKGLERREREREKRGRDRAREGRTSGVIAFMNVLFMSHRFENRFQQYFHAPLINGK